MIQIELAHAAWTAVEQVGSSSDLSKWLKSWSSLYGYDHVLCLNLMSWWHLAWHCHDQVQTELDDQRGLLEAHSSAQVCHVGVWVYWA